MNTYVLQNERLKVKVAVPGNEYKGSRFDWTGMITDIVLDNKYQFCSKESLIEGKGSGGIGLSNEFGIHEPIGYSEAKVGEEFPKLGIGLLKKDNNDDYNFFKQYSINEFEKKVNLEDNSITFICEPKEVNGYAVKYVKKVTINENELTVEYELDNVGEKSIHTTEYCHNFVAINNEPMSSDYILKFSSTVKSELKPEIFDISENTIEINQQVKEEFYCTLNNFSKDKGQYFELIHKPSKVSIRETVDFKIERMAIWGTPHVISPEMFISINIEPEMKQTWKRVYTFNNDNN